MAYRRISVLGVGRGGGGETAYRRLGKEGGRGSAYRRLGLYTGGGERRIGARRIVLAC